MKSVPENETSISLQLGAQYRRHLRIPFTASVEVIESKSGARLTGRINDLGQSGCYMDTLSSFPAGSEVLVRIKNGKDLFEAQARVVYDQSGMGMGIAFVSFTTVSAQLLQKWLLEITSKASAAQKTPAELRKNSDGTPKNNLLSTPPTKLGTGQRDMQQTPVVENTRWSPPVGRSTRNPGRAAQIGGAVAAVLLAGAATAWWGLRIRTETLKSPSPQTVPALTSEATTPIDRQATVTATDGPTRVGTTEEFTKVWAAKEFIFIDPITSQTVKAMVIRLPNRALWAFALREPHGQCDLEFVTDLNRLEKQYGYQSNHPMVASPCSGTVYNPLKFDAIGGNTWARGAVVQGGGLRPPISINVQVLGQSVIASQIE